MHVLCSKTLCLFLQFVGFYVLSIVVMTNLTANIIIFRDKLS